MDWLYLLLIVAIFGLSEFYRSRLVRCYLGATRNKRHPHPFTGFDEGADLPRSTPAMERRARTARQSSVLATRRGEP